jgi:hypothetical protein
MMISSKIEKFIRSSQSWFILSDQTNFVAIINTLVLKYKSFSSKLSNTNL